MERIFRVRLGDVVAHHLSTALATLTDDDDAHGTSSNITVKLDFDGRVEELLLCAVEGPSTSPATLLRSSRNHRLAPVMAPAEHNCTFVYSIQHKTHDTESLLQLLQRLKATIEVCYYRHERCATLQNERNDDVKMLHRGGNACTSSSSSYSSSPPPPSVVVVSSTTISIAALMAACCTNYRMVIRIPHAPGDAAATSPSSSSSSPRRTGELNFSLSVEEVVDMHVGLTKIHMHALQPGRRYCVGYQDFVERRTVPNHFLASTTTTLTTTSASPSITNSPNATIDDESLIASPVRRRRRPRRVGAAVEADVDGVATFSAQQLPPPLVMRGTRQRLADHHLQLLIYDVSGDDDGDDGAVGGNVPAPTTYTAFAVPASAPHGRLSLPLSSLLRAATCARETYRISTHDRRSGCIADGDLRLVRLPTFRAELRRQMHLLARYGPLPTTTQHAPMMNDDDEQNHHHARPSSRSLRGRRWPTSPSSPTSFRQLQEATLSADTLADAVAAIVTASTFTSPATSPNTMDADDDHAREAAAPQSQHQRMATYNSTVKQFPAPPRLHSQPTQPSTSSSSSFQRASELIHANDAEAETNFLLALDHGEVARARYMLEQQPQLIYRSNNCLHAACSTSAPNADLVEALLRRRPELVHGVDQHTGNSPLHFACMAAIPSRRVVEVLLHHHTPTQLVNHEGLTAFHVAALNHGDALGHTVKDTLLSLGGVDVDVACADGSTSLHLCCSHDSYINVVRFLVARGANVRAQTRVVAHADGGSDHPLMRHMPHRALAMMQDSGMMMDALQLSQVCGAMKVHQVLQQHLAAYM